MPSFHHAAELTADARFRELAKLLARGVVRALQRSALDLSIPRESSAKCLEVPSETRLSGTVVG